MRAGGSAAGGVRCGSAAKGQDLAGAGEVLAWHRPGHWWRRVAWHPPAKAVFGPAARARRSDRLPRVAPFFVCKPHESVY